MMHFMVHHLVVGADVDIVQAAPSAHVSGRRACDAGGDDLTVTSVVGAKRPTPTELDSRLWPNPSLD